MATTDPQIQKARDLASKVAAAPSSATSFDPAFASVADFIEALDKEAHLLGDGDFARFAIRACERRGKNLEDLRVLASIAKVGK